MDCSIYYHTELTNQSLTDDELLWLIGVAFWVFNSNVHLIIELIDREHHNRSNSSWFDFIRLTAGGIKDYHNLVVNILGEEIYDEFSKLVDERNAIMHSFPSGEKRDGYYVAIYRDKHSLQSTIIDKKYIVHFIESNQELCTKLTQFNHKNMQSYN